MVNNIEQIEKLLDFDIKNESWFYHLQIIHRRKENEGLRKNNIILGNYYISSLKYFNEILPEVKMVCNNTNSRAYINLNKKSYNTWALMMNKKVGDNLVIGEYPSLSRLPEKMASIIGNIDKDKQIWVLDIDDGDVKGVDPVLIVSDFVERIHNDGERRTITSLKTKNGWHLITYKFSHKPFISKFPNIEIHKNNPTLLYSM